MKFEPSSFLDSCIRFYNEFPHNVMLSAGWTVGPNAKEYTKEHVQAQFEVTFLSVHVCGCVFACVCIRAWAYVRVCASMFARVPICTRVRMRFVS